MPTVRATNGAQATTTLANAATRSPTGAGTIRIGILAAVLVAACSVNVSKLRAPKASAPDGPVAPDMRQEPDAEGDATSRDVARDATEVAATEVADAAEVAMPDGDARTPPEPPSRPEVGRPDRDEDVPVIGSGGAGGGGAGGGGAGDGGFDVGEATGGRDADEPGTGGSGGMDGTGGRTGPGGRTGTGGAFATGGTGIDPDLVLWYKFDESSGTVAADSAAFGTGGHDGKVAGYGAMSSATYAFTTDSQVGSHALSLSPASGPGASGGGYVTLPNLQTLAPDEITVALWVKLAAAGRAEEWERIFDCGAGTSATGPYFYMTARASDAPSNPVRFGISRSGNTELAEQRLEATYALTARVWHHIAVVLPPGPSYTGTLYIDGAVAATNDRMTLHLTDLATMTNNWLGRSQFSEDPFFNGALDDFRVYKRALSQSEIEALYALR